MNKAILEHSCSDKSDSIFPVESSCTSQKYEDTFQGLICPNSSSVTDMEICGNIKKWIDEKTSSAIDPYEYLDPHDCYSSCKIPGPGCEACTNEEYFQCTRNGTRVCIHPSLWCDGHPQCDHAVDEDLGFCHPKYLEKKLIEPYATKICDSIMYPNMKTVATVCNEFVECQGGVDEHCDYKELSRILLN